MNFDKGTPTIANRSFRIGAVFILLLLTSSCVVAENKNSSMKTFFQKTTSEQIDDFGRHQIEEQYELIYFGNKIVHPPAVYLISNFAKNGQAAVPLLEMKLESSRDDSEIRDIVMIFSEMSVQGSYLIPCESKTMFMLDKKISSLNSLWKPSLENAIQEMKLRNCPPSKRT